MIERKRVRKTPHLFEFDLEAFAFNFFDVSVAVGDDPVATTQLNGFAAFVGDLDLVGERESFLGRVGAILEVESAYADPDVFCGDGRHGSLRKSDSGRPAHAVSRRPLGRCGCLPDRAQVRESSKPAAHHRAPWWGLDESPPEPYWLRRSRPVT